MGDKVNLVILLQFSICERALGPGGESQSGGSFDG